MQVKRFWPPIHYKWLYVNLILYGLLILLLFLFHRELLWAQKALRGYLLTGQLDPPASRLLLKEALKYPNKGEEAKIRHRLLQRALQIDPYDMALLLLGDYYSAQGEDDRALDCYDRYLSIDPSFIDAYLKMVEILEKKQDRNTMNELLDRGITYFRHRIERYQPRYDPSVPKEYNLKALWIYNLSKKGLEQLEKIQKRQKENRQ